MLLGFGVQGRVCRVGLEFRVYALMGSRFVVYASGFTVYRCGV